jgi:hypothetical protein
MTTDAILTELRALPGAPESLRERVRALSAPKPRVAWALPRFDLRRTLLVLAPAVVALGVGAAALHGLLAGGTPQRPVAFAPGSGHVQQLRGAADSAKTPAFGIATVPAQQSFSGGSALQPQPLPPSATRLNKYEAWLAVRVTRDDLARAATRAMEIARGYGGYVSSVDMNTPGSRGTASLILRVPVTKVEDAVLRLGKLGTVTAQHVRIQDIQREADRQQQQILALQVTIARLESKLQDPSLPADQRVQLQFELSQAKLQLNGLTNAHANTVREGTLATVSVTFRVPSVAAAKPHSEGQFTRTLEDAGSFLGRELAWLLYALIVAGPIAVLATLALLGARAGRRRADDRLLERA